MSCHTAGYFAYRDSAVHLSHPNTSFTRPRRYKGQISTILASEAFDLTVGTSRLLFVALSSSLPARQTARPDPLLARRRGFPGHVGGLWRA